MCSWCGVETLIAVAPGGRAVELDADHVWIGADDPWPVHLFSIGVAPGGGGRLRPYAVPAIEFLDRQNGRPSGPYRRAHSCVWPSM